MTPTTRERLKDWIELADNLDDHGHHSIDYIKHAMPIVEAYLRRYVSCHFHIRLRLSPNRLATEFCAELYWPSVSIDLPAANKIGDDPKHECRRKTPIANFQGCGGNEQHRQKLVLVDVRQLVKPLDGVPIGGLKGDILLFQHRDRK